MKAPAYLGLIARNFDDGDVDTLIEHFRDKDRRKEFFKEYKEIEANERRKRTQAERGFDAVTYFIYATLLQSGITQPEVACQRIRAALVQHPNWTTSEKEQREVRQEITFALYAQEDDPDRVAAVVEQLLTLLQKAKQP